MKYEVEFQGEKELERRLAALVGDEKATKAVNAAMNKAAAKGHTRMASLTAEEVKIPPKVLKKRFAFYKANIRKPRYLYFRLKKISITAQTIGYHKASVKMLPNGQPARGWIVGNKSGKYSIKEKNAFETTVTDIPKIRDRRRKKPKRGIGQTHLFRREGRHRYGVEVVKYDIFSDGTKAMKKVTQELLDTEIPKEMVRYLNYRILKEIGFA